MQRRTLFTVAAALSLSALWGCNPPATDSTGGTTTATKDTQPDAGGKKKVIAVIPKGLTHVFWQSVKSGADKAGTEFGVEIKWDGPQKENDQAGQIAVVENAIASKVDGIALAPLDKAALVPVIKKINDAKIPCVIFDSGADTEDYLSFIATDNRKGGVMAAERMGKILDGKGKIAMIPNQANSASTMEREEGFATTIKEKFPGMTLITGNLADSDRSKAIRVAEDLFSAHPDIVGIFGSCEPCAIGAMMAVKNRNLVGKVKVIGFDNTKQMDDAVGTGEIDSLVIQNPSKMGYESVKAILDKINGKPVEKRIDTGVVIMDKESREKPEMAEFRAK